MNNFVLNDYFDWLYFTVLPGKNNERFRKLLSALHSIVFRYFIDYDENRAIDGVNLRWYYVCDGGDDSIMDWQEPCTVLEMLIALAMRMDNIMGGVDGECNVPYWFWMLLHHIDLAEMTDEHFDKNYLHKRVDMFLDREYEPDGYGNIFHIQDCREDLRTVEIWTQMCWYLDSIM
jgi:hypothetical protein